MNQQANLNDVFELTRAEINMIINGLAEAPAKSVYQLIRVLAEKHPSKLAPAQAAVQAEATASAEATGSTGEVAEETKTTEQ